MTAIKPVDRFFIRAVLAELFATSLFIMMVTMVVVRAGNFLTISFGIGLSVAILVQIFGPISGAHMNPAVTLAFLVKGDVDILKAVAYIFAQLVGGILGSAFTYAMTPASLRGNLGTLAINSEMNVGQGFAVEMFFTLVLDLTIFSSVCSDNGRQNFGFANALAIGIAVVTAHLVGIPYTGAGINPARALGPAAVTGNFVKEHWIYWVGPIVGAVLAGLIYRFLLSPEEETRYAVRTKSDPSYIADKNGDGKVTITVS